MADAPPTLRIHIEWKDGTTTRATGCTLPNVIRSMVAANWRNVIRYAIDPEPDPDEGEPVRRSWQRS